HLRPLRGVRKGNLQGASARGPLYPALHSVRQPSPTSGPRAVNQGEAPVLRPGGRRRQPNMSQETSHRHAGWTERLAHQTTTWVGSSWAFFIAALLTLSWLISGPIFHFSDTWQLVMNTISSIVTFLMVFLLQRSQNKDSLAMQIKLKEILGALRGASNRLINVEDLSEDQVRALHERYEKLTEKVKSNGYLTESLPIEQAVAKPKSPSPVPSIN